MFSKGMRVQTKNVMTKMFIILSEKTIVMQCYFVGIRSYYMAIHSFVTIFRAAIFQFCFSVRTTFPSVHVPIGLIIFVQFGFLIFRMKTQTFAVHHHFLSFRLFVF